MPPLGPRKPMQRRQGAKKSTGKSTARRQATRKQIIVRRLKPKQQQPSIGSQLNVGRDIRGSQVIQTLHGNAVFHHGIATVARPLPRGNKR